MPIFAFLYVPKPICPSSLWCSALHYRVKSLAKLNTIIAQRIIISATLNTYITLSV
jgi:hypothetical protein